MTLILPRNGLRLQLIYNRMTANSAFILYRQYRHMPYRPRVKRRLHNRFLLYCAKHNLTCQQRSLKLIAAASTYFLSASGININIQITAVYIPPLQPRVQVIGSNIKYRVRLPFSVYIAVKDRQTRRNLFICLDNR